MRKKILVTITVLAVIAALAVAFSGAQFFLVSTSGGNLLTFGKIAATEWSPNPALFSEKLLVPGETRTSQVKLYPKGDIPQDIYFGIKDETWQSSEALGEAIQVRLSVDGATWTSWVNIHDWYTGWTLIKSSAAPDSTIILDVQMKFSMDIGPEYMGVSYWFKTFIDAVQVGGAPPTTAPYLFTP